MLRHRAVTLCVGLLCLFVGLGLPTLAQITTNDAVYGRMFGSGIGTWLGTPSSANLASALTDETGSGLAVFGTSPTITGLAASAIASGTLDAARVGSGTAAANTYLVNGAWAAAAPQIAPDLFPNPTLVAVYNASISTGDTDLYTVPSSRKALVLSQPGVLYNASGVGNIIALPQVSISGTYYRVAGAQTISNANAGQWTLLNAIVLEAGQKFAINTTTNNGLVYTGFVLEFDATSALSSTTKTSFTNGDNALFTASAATQVVTISTTVTAIPTLSGNIAASAGTTVAAYSTYTPSGGSLKPMATSANVTGGATGVRAVPVVLASGDVIGLNVATGASMAFAWVNTITR